MIFHIPTDTTLISTDVAYQVPLYDETATYSDGDEVRQGNDIYTVSVIETHNEYPLASSYTYYDIKSKVHIGEFGFEKVDEVYSPAFFGDILSDNPTFKYPRSTTGQATLPTRYPTGVNASADDVALIETAWFTAWDGTTYDTWGAEGSHYVKFVHIDSFEEFDSVDLYKADDDSGTNSVKLGNIKYTNDVRKDIDKSFYRVPAYGGTVRQVRLKTTDFISGNGLERNVWKALPSNEDVIVTYKLNYLRPSIRKVPFDTKQYTSAKVNSSQTWVVKAPKTYLSINRDKVSSILLGKIVATDLHIDFLDLNSNVLYSKDIVVSVNSISYDLQNATDVEPSTYIIYIPQSVYHDVHQASITISDSNLQDTEIGFISFANHIDVGATNLTFTHDIKNFDKNKVSEVSGYIDHIKGQRVVQHKGSFDIPLTDYDKMLMINKRFTQELIAIDGSDATNNEASDSKNIFQSTKLIGRTKRLGMTTRTKQNKLDDTQTITFEFEEVV